jgi:tRNA1Val (adenine37-N6)-methyltransferase
MGRNNWFEFKQFRIEQKYSAMKVGTDGVLLGAWTLVENSSRIFDVGTGTGLVALMLAQRCNANIDAVEIDEKAFQEAGHNFSQSMWHNRLKVFHGDFLKHSLKDDDEKYDLIVSNPPFFVNSLKTKDPQLALAKHDINMCIEQLINKTQSLLKADGRLTLIFPYSITDQVKESARLAGFFVKRRTDVFAKPSKTPIRTLMELSLKPVFPEINQLVIRDDSNQFSSSFKELTSPYYLNF